MQTCLAIFLFVVPLIMLIFANSPSKERDGKKWLSLEPDKNLIKQRLFWISLSIPVYYFIYFGLFVWTKYQLELSEEAFRKFIDISIFPFGILSLTIPFTYIAARIHATEQTARLIKLTDEKNRIEAFNNHRNELFNYFDHIQEIEYWNSFTAKFALHPQIHKSFFIDNHENGLPVSDEDAFGYLGGRILKMISLVDDVYRSSLKGNYEQAISSYFIKVIPVINELADFLHLPEINHYLLLNRLTVNRTLPNSKKTITWSTIGATRDDFIASVRYIYTFSFNLHEFAGVSFPHIPFKSRYLLHGVEYRQISLPACIDAPVSNKEESIQEIVKVLSTIDKN